ncbi:MAG: type II toxin-antitoxin system HicB family antitoxin [Candidatus Peregrinibacteria bacterium]|nr:type II toxin-antitoxin system HicB family antitoxin [Candidatus Peregrinibacteria bacterium]
MVFTAVIHREGDLFVANCPEVGSVSQGESMEQALQNLQEATELYLEEFPNEASADRSFITTFQATRA